MSDEGTRKDQDFGSAGASAREEHARRRARREQRVVERHPRIGPLLLALGDAPAHERAWQRGAIGEQMVAASLARRLGDEAVLLHDRRVPRSRGNIDHLVVAPCGVWVIDAKRYRGRVAIAKPWFEPARLTIAGRDRTALVTGVRRQVAAVETVVADEAVEVPVRGALCFVDAELPLLGSLCFDGVPLLYPRALAKRIRAADVVLAPEQVMRLATALAQRLPPA